MEQTRILIQVHREGHTTEDAIGVNSNVTMGNAADATIPVLSDHPYLFTLIHYDEVRDQIFLQFTDALKGWIKFPDRHMTLAELKRSDHATCIPLLGLWAVEIPPETTGFVALETFTVSFTIRHIVKTRLTNAA